MTGLREPVDPPGGQGETVSHHAHGQVPLGEGPRDGVLVLHEPVDVASGHGPAQPFEEHVRIVAEGGLLEKGDLQGAELRLRDHERQGLSRIGARVDTGLLPAGDLGFDHRGQRHRGEALEQQLLALEHRIGAGDPATVDLDGRSGGVLDGDGAARPRLILLVDDRHPEGDGRSHFQLAEIVDSLLERARREHQPRVSNLPWCAATLRWQNNLTPD